MAIQDDPYKAVFEAQELSIAPPEQTKRHVEYGPDAWEAAEPRDFDAEEDLSGDDYAPNRSRLAH